jgi:hypothetical protein
LGCLETRSVLIEAEPVPTSLKNAIARDKTSNRKYYCALRI